MKKRKVDLAKQVEKARKDAARMKQMAEATASEKERPSREDFSQAAVR